MEEAAAPTTLQMISSACVGIGALIAVIYWIVLIVIAFKSSAGHGILVLLLGSLGALIFACMQWPRAGGKFIAHAIGLVIMIVGFVIGVISVIPEEGLDLENLDNSELIQPR